MPVLPVYLFAMRRAGTAPHRGGKALSVVVHGGRGRDRRRRWRLPLDPAASENSSGLEPEPADTYHYGADYSAHVARNQATTPPPKGTRSPAANGSLSQQGARESRSPSSRLGVGGVVKGNPNIGLGSRRNALGLLEWLENSFVELSKPLPRPPQHHQQHQQRRVPAQPLEQLDERQHLQHQELVRASSEQQQQQLLLQQQQQHNVGQQDRNGRHDAIGNK